jgi:hypothetical protein
LLLSPAATTRAAAGYVLAIPGPASALGKVVADARDSVNSQDAL